MFADDLMIGDYLYSDSVLQSMRVLFYVLDSISDQKGLSLLEHGWLGKELWVYIRQELYHLKRAYGLWVYILPAACHFSTQAARKLALSFKSKDADNSEDF